MAASGSFASAEKTAWAGVPRGDICQIREPIRQTSEIRERRTKPDMVVFLAYSCRHILGDDRDICPTRRRCKAPRHPHLARKSWVIGLERHELNHSLVLDQLGKPTFDDIGVVRCLAGVRMVAVIGQRHPIIPSRSCIEFVNRPVMPSGGSHCGQAAGSTNAR